MGATWNRNTERDGVEIHFTEKPSEAIRADLKIHGWRWSKFSACWYHKDSPEAQQYARELTGGLTGVLASAAEPTAPAAPTRRKRANGYKVRRSYRGDYDEERGGGCLEIRQNPRGRCEDAPCCGCCD